MTSAFNGKYLLIYNWKPRIEEKITITRLDMLGTNSGTTILCAKKQSGCFVLDGSPIQI
jgi:hypothetical protein